MAGGQARLQLAVCLDSLSRGEEAKRLYTSLGKHPNLLVQKQANRMLWGARPPARLPAAGRGPPGGRGADALRCAGAAPAGAQG